MGWFDLCLRRKAPLAYREIRLGTSVNKDYAQIQRRFASNTVVTSKYSVFTFLPRSLFEQFRRLANVYFLLISVLMLIGTYGSFFDSPLDPWSTLSLLIIVLMISICKECAEDIKRHIADRQTNYSKAERISESSDQVTESIYWEGIRVGDLILLHNNHEIPADMIILASSDSMGHVYLETSNIDGETNLKLRNSAKTSPSGSVWKTPADLKSTNMVIQCEHPNSDIHNFHGTIFWNHKEIAVDATNFILRGSSIRSTSWVVGVVVYTGRESKIILNSRAAPSKLSTIEKTMNNLIYVIFSAQVLLSTISLVCYLVWNSYHSHDLYYLCFNSASSPNPLYRQSCVEKGDYSATGYFFTYFVLYNNFLPISLYVTVEFCNYVQAYFIDNDLKMYDPTTDTPAYARTSNMNGDLGMIEYVFSDKTGTLTENNMIFKRCSVGGVVYYSDSKSPEDVSVGLLQEFLADPDSIQSHFVYVLSVAHTVVIDRETGGYQSESPDEETLVKAGENLGWKFTQRLPQGVSISRVTSPEGPEITKTFEILAIIPFDSTRKRMSVLVRHPDSNHAVLYCKGADNIIFERATSYAPGSSRVILDDHLSDFATAGLRTLAIAMRVIPNQLLSEFMEIWKKAEGTVIGRKELVQRAAAVVEKDLMVLGVTAIEDKLQEDVPETIADLGLAGVKLWVLTGDKVQTAINIGYSSRLLGPNMMLIHLHSINDDALGLKQRITGILLKLKRITEDDELVRHIRKSLQDRIATSITPVPTTDHFPTHSGHGHDGDMLPSADSHPPQLPSFESLTSDHLALIIDGDVLTKLLGDVQAERLLLMLGKICKSVLACRVSPEQKRLLVRLVRRGISPQPVTLAIGDGANDVAMIQEAQIGVGISGKEGRQAVNASDFAIAQFRFLKRLMLVHGRSDYRRVSRVILFSLYKNIVLTITLFFFTFFNGFSGQTFFDDFVYSGYNLFLALPVLAIGVFDRDVSPSLLEKYNILYVTGRERQDMNLSVFCLHLLHSLVDACIIFFLVYEAFRDGDVVGPRGKDEDLWVFGAIVYNCLFISQCLRCAWSSYTWNWVSVFLWVVSLIFYFGFLFLYEEFPYFYNYYKVTQHTVHLPLFWLLGALVPVISISVDILFTAIQREFFPSLLDVCIEYDRGFRSHSATTAASISASSSLTTTDDDLLVTPPGSTSKETEANLSWSRIVGANKRFPLDWATMTSLFSSFGPGEKENYGIQDTSATHPRSSFIYDFVSRDYGPGAGLSLISSAFNQVGQAIFGTDTAPSAHVRRGSRAIENGGMQLQGAGGGTVRAREAEEEEVKESGGSSRR